jgi:Fe2+ or Zn2+ uptake regulation protein
METGIKDILKKNKLSITASREKILHLFMEQEGALAHGDIEKRAGEKFDRVTVYRTHKLKWWLREFVKIARQKIDEVHCWLQEFVEHAWFNGILKNKPPCRHTGT